MGRLTHAANITIFYGFKEGDFFYEREVFSRANLSIYAICGFLPWAFGLDLPQVGVDALSGAL